MKCSWCKSKFLPKKGYAVSGAAARNVRISEAGGMDAILKKSQQQDMALEQISVSNRRNKPPSKVTPSKVTALRCGFRINFCFKSKKQTTFN